MRYISTRSTSEPVSFSEAIFQGLAPDSGLFLPETIPVVNNDLPAWQPLSYTELAFEIIRLFTAETIPADALKHLIHKSYVNFDHPQIAPLIAVGDIWIQELFHGPTLAFKDIALQFVGNLFEYLLLHGKRRHITLIVATSGDTGSAAIHACADKKNIRLFVLHPHKKISPIQEAQMTTVLVDNIYNIAIHGSFDDAQAIVKCLFQDQQFKADVCLSGVNSLNWARLVAQIVYYFYAAFRMREANPRDRLRMVIPTGNFGNIFAGYFAIRMGAPIDQLILASNENNILAQFFQTGEYTQGIVKETLSPAMDIQAASNFERYLYYYFQGDRTRLQNALRSFEQAGSFSVERQANGIIDPLIASGHVNDAQILATIHEYYHALTYLLDPHSAVAVHISKQQKFIPYTSTVCLATAHPAKFPQTIRKALAEDIARHEYIEQLKGLSSHCEILPASVSVIKSYIKKQL